MIVATSWDYCEDSVISYVWHSFSLCSMSHSRHSIMLVPYCCFSTTVIIILCIWENSSSFFLSYTFYTVVFTLQTICRYLLSGKNRAGDTKGISVFQPSGHCSPVESRWIRGLWEVHNMNFCPRVPLPRLLCGWTFSGAICSAQYEFLLSLTSSGPSCVCG